MMWCTVQVNIHHCSKVWGQYDFFIFIKQGCIKLVKSDIKGFCNTTKDFNFK